VKRRKGGGEGGEVSEDEEGRRGGEVVKREWYRDRSSAILCFFPSFTSHSQLSQERSEYCAATDRLQSNLQRVTADFDSTLSELEGTRTTNMLLEQQVSMFLVGWEVVWLSCYMYGCNPDMIVSNRTYPKACTE